MKSRVILWGFIGAFVFFIISLTIYMVFEEKRVDKEFFDLLQKGDEEELLRFLEEVSNKSFSKYLYFSSLKDYSEGKEKEAIRGFVSLISNGSISEKEMGVAKFIVGYYLLFERNDIKGMKFVLSPESCKYFPEYVNYVVGLYNFEKENYDEALRFFLGITNAKDEVMRRNVLTRIAFIELAKGGKVSRGVKEQLERIDRELFYNLIKE